MLINIDYNKLCNNKNTQNEQINILIQISHFIYLESFSKILKKNFNLIIYTKNKILFCKEYIFYFVLLWKIIKQNKGLY